TVAFLGGCGSQPQDLVACIEMAVQGFRPIAIERDSRFLGKVQESTARCRGGARTTGHRAEPWVDWQTYWATADDKSRAARATFNFGHLNANGPGVDGALLDLEYQRIQLIKFNLFDNTGTYKDSIVGRPGIEGPAITVWSEMRLPQGHPQYEAVGGAGKQQCGGDLIRARTLTGICNDLDNPLMGS